MKIARFSEKQIIGVLKELERENAKLQRLLADAMLDEVALIRRAA